MLGSVSNIYSPSTNRQLVSQYDVQLDDLTKHMGMNTTKQGEVIGVCLRARRPDIE